MVEMYLCLLGLNSGRSYLKVVPLDASEQVMTMTSNAVYQTSYSSWGIDIDPNSLWLYMPWLVVFVVGLYALKQIYQRH